MYTIAIVDDEQESIDEFKTCLSRYFSEYGNGNEYRIVEFHDGSELLDNYKPNYDIIFLDIEMEQLDGINAARKIRNLDDHTAIIFLTRMARYAINGYDVQAIDFIVKPLDYDKFAVKFRKALDYVESTRTTTIEIKSTEGMRYVSGRDIYYLEVLDHKLIYHTIQGNIETYGTFKDAQVELEEEGSFYPCNRCYLVNLRYVNGTDGSSVYLSSGESLIISRHKKKDFLAAVARYYGQGRVG